MNDIILVERNDDIAAVILNRPEKMNALSRALWTEVGEVMATLSADETLRCIVIRGAGDKAFRYLRI
jgi:enoyl-CoA hydratase/carnithine racemase